MNKEEKDTNKSNFLLSILFKIGEEKTFLIKESGEKSYNRIFTLFLRIKEEQVIGYQNC